jgi:hypothetical protein
VERVGALHRVRAALGHDLGDPVGLIGGHVGDRGAAFGAKYVEEPTQGRPVPARCGPQQSARVVIDHHGQEPVPALVGDLVDADTPQPVQAVTEGLDVDPDAGDDRTDGAPGDAHQLGNRALRTLGHQPGDGLVEGQRVPGAVACPRHVRHDNPVLSATDPRRLRLEEHPRRAGVQPPPASSSLAGVVASAAAAAHPAPAPGPACRPHPRNEQLVGLIELDTLDDRLLDAQQGAKYPGVAHAVLRSLVPDLRQARNLGGNGVFSTKPRS